LLTLVLADARLDGVRSAFGDGKDAAGAKQAAALMRGAIEQHRPSGVEKVRWAFLFGRILVGARDYARAAEQFDIASAEPAWVLQDRARVEAAEAYLLAGRYAEARSRADSVNAGSLAADRASLVKADALEALSNSGGLGSGVGDRESSLAIWRNRLANKPNGERWEQGALKVARANLEPPVREENVVDALRLVRRVQSEAPSTTHDSEARALEQEALGKLDLSVREKHLVWPVETTLRRAQVLADRGRRTDALRQLDLLLGGMSDEQRLSSVGCVATGLKGKLLGQVKSTRDASASAYLDAVVRCERHKSELVGVLYSGGRIMSQVGRLAESLGMYGRVEREFAEHRLADDARLRGARVVLLMRDESRFESMLSTMGRDYPDGDMVEDGLFELALHHIGKGVWAKAVDVLGRSVQLRPREKQYWVSGRAMYFLGRSHEAMGRVDQANALYRQVIVENPLSYYMVLSHGRLGVGAVGRGDDVIRQAESLVSVGGNEGLPDRLKYPAFDRAVELLRLGDVVGARGEVQSLGLGVGDGESLLLVAGLYSRVGELRLAHQVVRGRSDDWSRWYPVGRWRGVWELGYPRMYLDVVSRESREFGISQSLAYGIMREESAFDAGAVSSADAYGLMQLIMPTAQGVAKRLNMTVNVGLLKQPEVNIRLGCSLLGSLRSSFPGQVELAVPSYNAGAGATRRWLTEGGEDFDLWVERIPYEETRGYMKRVLSSVVVYSYLYERGRLGELMRFPGRVGKVR